jgi:hypothetical protein
MPQEHQELNNAILEGLGLEGRPILKLTLTLEACQPPIVEYTEYMTNTHLDTKKLKLVFRQTELGPIEVKTVISLEPLEPQL